MCQQLNSLTALMLQIRYESWPIANKHQNLSKTVFKDLLVCNNFRQKKNNKNQSLETKIENKIKRKTKTKKKKEKPK